MRVHNGVRDQMAERGEIAFARFDGVQGLRAPLKRFRVILVILGSSGIKIPVPGCNRTGSPRSEDSRRQRASLFSEK